MRDENNRNTLPELIYLEYETKRKIDETDMIPEDDIRDVNTYTTQSLSSEEADHSGYDQNESAPADAKPPAAVINPDHSALDAWEAAGAEPYNRTIAGEPASGPRQMPSMGRSPKRRAGSHWTRHRQMPPSSMGMSVRQENGWIWKVSRRRGQEMR